MRSEAIKSGGVPSGDRIATGVATAVPLAAFVFAVSQTWGGLLQWLRGKVLAANNIVQEDIDSIRLVDEPEQVRDIVVAYHEKALRTRSKEEKPLPVATERRPEPRRMPRAKSRGRRRISK